MTYDVDVLARVIAVANGKGGVGKTSMVTTVAGIAAAAQYRILVIDLDPQGNVGEDLGYTGAELGDDGAGLVASLVSGGPLVVSVPQARVGVDVIAGGERLDDLAGLLLSRYRRGEDVATALAEPLAELLTESEYDLVLIDCPPGEPTLQLLALAAARWLIIPTKADSASVKGMARIAARLVQARNDNPRLELLGVVLFDMPSSATRLRRDITAQITEALGGVAPLFQAVIRHSVAAVGARSRGMLIHEYAGELAGEPFWKALRDGRTPTTPGTAPALAADYTALTHEILTRIDALERAQDEQEADAV